MLKNVSLLTIPELSHCLCIQDKISMSFFTAFFIQKNLLKSVHAQSLPFSVTPITYMMFKANHVYLNLRTNLLCVQYLSIANVSSLVYVCELALLVGR